MFQDSLRKINSEKIPQKYILKTYVANYDMDMSYLTLNV